MRARQLKKGGTKWDFNGGHLHARKSEDQANSPQISLTAAAGCWQAYPCLQRLVTLSKKVKNCKKCKKNQKIEIKKMNN